MEIKENDICRVRLTNSEKNKDIITDLKNYGEAIKATLECAAIIKRKYKSKQKRVLFFKKDVYEDGYFFEIYYRNKEYPNFTLKRSCLNRVFDSFESAEECFNDVFEIGTPENGIMNISTPFEIISECWCDCLCLLRDVHTDNIYIVAKDGNKVTGISPYYNSDQKILTYREWKKVKWALENESKRGRKV